MNLAESDITAPLADVIIDVLKLAAERHRNEDALERIVRVVAVLDSYAPEPELTNYLAGRYREGVTEALDYLRLANRHLEAALAVDLSGSDIAAHRRRLHSLEQRTAAELEARTVIRRKITLEGPDL